MHILDIINIEFGNRKAIGENGLSLKQSMSGLNIFCPFRQNHKIWWKEQWHRSGSQTGIVFAVISLG